MHRQIKFERLIDRITEHFLKNENPFSDPISELEYQYTRRTIEHKIKIYGLEYAIKLYNIPKNII
jgi:hypothetical protein